MSKKKPEQLEYDVVTSGLLLLVERVLRTRDLELVLTQVKAINSEHPMYKEIVQGDDPFHDLAWESALECAQRRNIKETLYHKLNRIKREGGDADEFKNS